MTNEYVVHDVSRQQAGDLWHAADSNSDPFSNWVARRARYLYRQLDLGETGELTFNGNGHSRALKITEDYADHVDSAHRPKLADSWDDLFDRLDNATVKP